MMSQNGKRLPTFLVSRSSWRSSNMVILMVSHNGHRLPTFLVSWDNWRCSNTVILMVSQNGHRLPTFLASWDNWRSSNAIILVVSQNGHRLPTFFGSWDNWRSFMVATLMMSQNWDRLPTFVVRRRNWNAPVHMAGKMWTWNFEVTVRTATDWVTVFILSWADLVWRQGNILVAVARQTWTWSKCTMLSFLLVFYTWDRFSTFVIPWAIWRQRIPLRAMMWAQGTCRYKLFFECDWLSPSVSFWYLWRWSW